MKNKLSEELRKQVTGLIEKSREIDIKRGCVEVEGRLGHFDTKTGKFISSVSAEYFNTCLDMCNSYKSWGEVVEWYPRKDYFLKDGIRSSVTDTHCCHNAECIKKKKIGNLTFQIHDDLSTFSGKFIGEIISVPTAIRISSSEEIKVANENINAQNPALTRFKIIKQFKTKSGWSIDFSKVWTSTDTQEVIDASSALDRFNESLEQIPESYEMEIELENPSYLRQYNSKHVAESLVLKLCDFLPNSIQLQ